MMRFRRLGKGQEEGGEPDGGLAFDWYEQAWRGGRGLKTGELGESSCDGKAGEVGVWWRGV